VSTTFNAVDYVPIQASLAILDRLTEEQRVRLRTLVTDFSDTQRVVLTSDSWSPDNVMFTLVGPMDRHVLSGMIEPDGSSHT